MLLIDCPYCGKRPELEFTYGGQAHLARPSQPSELDDQAWAEFLYMRTNIKGVYAERWRHARGCGRFFNALRDTTTDHFLAFYKTGEAQPVLPAPGAPPAPGSTLAPGSTVASGSTLAPGAAPATGVPPANERAT